MIDRTFGLRAWGLACLGAAIVGGLLFWITPFKLPQAMVMALIAGAAGTLGEFVMTALKRDAGVNYWGNSGQVTGAVGLPRPRRSAVLRGARVLPLGALVLPAAELTR